MDRICRVPFLNLSRYHGKRVMQMYFSPPPIIGVIVLFVVRPYVTSAYDRQSLNKVVFVSAEGTDRRCAAAALVLSCQSDRHVTLVCQKTRWEPLWSWQSPSSSRSFPPWRLITVLTRAATGPCPEPDVSSSVSYVRHYKGLLPSRLPARPSHRILFILWP
jgi:hypothetical protein